MSDLMASVQRDEEQENGKKKVTPGPGAYDISDSARKTQKGYSFGPGQNDQLRIRLGYDPLKF